MARNPKALLASVRAEGRAKLLEHEALLFCEAHGLPVPKFGVARSSVEAVRIAERIGFPVALKVVSPDIIHKSDIGGVVLGVKTPEEVEEKYSAILRNVEKKAPGARVYGVLVQEMLGRGLEVIVGAVRDPHFGPVVMVGVGGVFVEVLRDVSFRAAPVTPVDVEEMLRDLKGYRLFEGFRGEPPRDRQALVDIVVRVSRLIADHEEISEVDLNPVIVFAEGQGAKVADARFILR